MVIDGLNLKIALKLSKYPLYPKEPSVGSGYILCREVCVCSKDIFSIIPFLFLYLLFINFNRVPYLLNWVKADNVSLFS